MTKECGNFQGGNASICGLEDPEAKGANVRKCSDGNVYYVCKAASDNVAERRRMSPEEEAEYIASLMVGCAGYSAS